MTPRFISRPAVSTQVSRTSKGELQVARLPEVASPQPRKIRGERVSPPSSPAARPASSGLESSENWAASVMRLETSISAQAESLGRMLETTELSPATLALSLVLDPSAGRAQEDDLIVALEVARRVGFSLDVVLAAGSGVPLAVGLTANQPTVERSDVLRRYRAAILGASAPRDPATREWLERTLDQRTPRADSYSAALDTAQSLLDRAPEQVQVRAVVLATSEGLQQEWQARKSMLQQQGISAAPMTDSGAAQKLQSAAAKALLESAALALRDHVQRLQTYRDELAEYVHEDQRVLADVWLRTETTTSVSSHRSVTVRDKMIDPLAIDLSGKGIGIAQLDGKGLVVAHNQWQDQSVTKKVSYFYNCRTYVTEEWKRTTRETTTFTHRQETRFKQWVDRNSGVIVWDRDGDGVQAQDLFGDSSATGRKASNGFEDLKQAAGGANDISRGGQLYRRLRVWRDANGNGLQESNELLTLEQAGISKLRLSYHATQDGQLRQQSTYRTLRADELEAKLNAQPGNIRRRAELSEDGSRFVAVGSVLSTPKDVDAEIRRQLAKLKKMEDLIAAG
jgi:hypothetical protein